MDETVLLSTPLQPETFTPQILHLPLQVTLKSDLETWKNFLDIAASDVWY